MKTYKFFGLIFLLIFSTYSCEIEEIENPNGPSLGSLVNGATSADLQLLITGVEAVMRNDLQFYYNTVSIVGREYYDLNGTDPRYTGELLGAGDGEGVLDDNGFLTTRSFSARYRAIKNINVLIEATENNGASLSDAEKNGFLGFANTMKAYALLLVANRQYNNGIRVDVSDPDNLGPFTASHEASLDAIQKLLNDAATELSNGGDDFAFSLSSGFSGFDAVGSFLQFNKALSARVALYQNDNASAMTYLSESFFDMNSGLNDGPNHAFGGNVGNDMTNPVYFVPNSDLYLAQNSFVSDADTLDNRLSKVTMLVASADLAVPVVLDGLSGTYQASVYSDNTSPISIIRNEELVLIYAEANIGADNAKVLEAIDLVRSWAGLDAYSGDTDDASLTDELLHQRRYSLFGEGHRWIDMRRHSRLASLPLDRAGDQVFEQFPRPVAEQ